MQINSRELVLAWVTGFVALIAISMAICSSTVKQWDNLKNEKKLIDGQLRVARHWVEQKDESNTRLEEVKKKLTQYPANEDVSGSYQRILEGVFTANGVTISQRTPQKEKKEVKQKNLYSTSITYNWEADLGSLINFLNALEKQKETMDIGELTVKPVDVAKGRLGGRFTVICVYTRSGTPSSEKKEPPPPAKAKK